MALFPLGWDCILTCGDLIEAVFPIRAHRTTLPRLGASRPVDTAAMAVDRRGSSATFKDLSGGQVLGPAFDCTHRPLDMKLGAEGEVAAAPAQDATPEAQGDTAPPDLTREPLELPAARPLRLQALARRDEGFILSLVYSTQRGLGRIHALVGELRIGRVAVEAEILELGFCVEIGEVELTESETVNQFKGSRTKPPRFTRGYGLVFGQSERKAVSMSLVDRAPRWRELGEDDTDAPGAGRGIRALSLRQHPGDWLPGTYQAAALC